MKNNKIVIANWKMRLGLAESKALAKSLSVKFKKYNGENEIVICPDYISLSEVKNNLKNSCINLGAQDVFWEIGGEYTGEISAKNLIEVGCRFVIIGHSERRKYLAENYSMINQKIKQVLSEGKITPIVCVGETKNERKQGRTEWVVLNQLRQALGGIKLSSKQRIIIAYEPVWAIGTGRAVKAGEVENVLKVIEIGLNDLFSQTLVKNNLRLIYGGSVNGKNVKTFINKENIDGFLVGGASLKADEFYTIVNLFK